ncbi:MAG: UDP-N-acetylmuramoyl-L-alanyl-D-glutamate--2,6-diaminopimelate ligase [Caldilineaceae bacterium]|nr:UDP-N-acetylmuramoyl-L-alanyl-D-glutamate--2,6-diaminopimelate ligase [Caldilineaceae bacterium]
MPSLESLLPLLTAAHVAQGEPAHIEFAGVTSDSRAVVPGALFVAIQGYNVDGHRYIPAALEKGAVAVIGTRPFVELVADGIQIPSTAPYIEVANSRLALAQVSAALYDFPSRDLTVIGVTGTDGKTTTATLIESIANVATRSEQDEPGDVGVITTVAARIRGQESETGFHVTTPDATEVQRYLAEMRAASCRYAIVESTSFGLDQERVAAVDFDIAAVTNITHEHLDIHGTRDAYVQAKAKLFRALYTRSAKADLPRCAVLNGDDEGSYGALCAALDEESARHDFRVPRRVYGVRASLDEARAALVAGTLDVVATDVQYTPRETRFTLLWQDNDVENDFEIVTPLIGDFNVYNITCAATVALALGLSPATIRQGVSEMTGVSGRMERIEAGQDFLAVVDFAHSPFSLERALHTLRPLVGLSPSGQPGRLIAVFGSAGLRDKAKRGLMGEISGRLADFSVVTAEDPRTEDLDLINQAIAEGVRQSGVGRRYAVVPDRTEAIQLAVDIAQPGDVVAAFGKGHERSMCYGTTEYPWSDQEAMRNALQRRVAQSGGQGRQRGNPA